MAVALVNKSVLAVESIPDNRFHMKPACSLCSEEFDSRLRIPKVLNCGHTFCVQCINKTIESVQVVYIGDGDAQTNFVCGICKSSMAIPSRGADSFPNNHQLLAASKDSRYVQCSNCGLDGIESSFHICRECTIQNHQFDVHTILESESTIHPDAYVVCSTCVLKEHNVRGHTVIEYLPIRLDHQYKTNMLSVNVHSAEAKEKFALLRAVLFTLPILVEKKEKEVSDMVELVRRAKSSQSQRLIFEKYKQEISTINKILDELSTQGGKLNSLLTDKVAALNRLNSETGSVHCLLEVPDLSQVLKIPTEVEVPAEPPVDPIAEIDAEIPEEPMEPEEPVAAPVRVPLQTAIRPEVFEIVEDVQDFGAKSIDRVMVVLGMILKRVWEFVKFGAVWLYNLRSVQSARSNNYNNEYAGIEKQWIFVAIGIFLITVIIIRVMF